MTDRNVCGTRNSRCELWEGPDATFSHASKIGQVNATHYLRPGLNLSDTRYYWVRAQDTSGNFSTFAGPGHATTNAVDAADITGQLIATQIADAAITGAKIADQAIDITKIDTPGGYGLPVYVTALPGSGSPLRYSGSIVLLSTDGKLYRFMGGAWTKAVDGGDIAANSIVSNAIVAGAITAPLIAAGAVTAGKLFVGDTTNLIVDSLFQDQTGYWSEQDSIGTVTGFSTNATVAALLNAPAMAQFDLGNIPAGSSAGFLIATLPFAINGGKQYRFRMDAFSGAGNKNLYVRLQFWDGTGTAISTVFAPSGGLAPAAFNPQNEYEYVFAAPSNAATLQISLRVVGNSPDASAGTSNWFIGNPRLERQVTGTLIKDGEIDTSHIVVAGLDASAITAGTITGDRMSATFLDSNRYTTVHAAGQPFIEINGQSNTVGGHQNGPWFRVNDGTHDRVIVGQLQDLWGLWLKDSGGNLIFEEASLGTAVVATGNIAANAVTLPYSFTLSGNLTLSSTGWTQIWTQSFTLSAAASVLLSTTFFGHFLAGTGTANGFRVKLDGTVVTAINALCEIIVSVAAGSHSLAIEGQGDTAAPDPFILQSGATATILACQR